MEIIIVVVACTILAYGALKMFGKDKEPYPVKEAKPVDEMTEDEISEALDDAVESPKEVVETEEDETPELEDAVEIEKPKGSRELKREFKAKYGRPFRQADKDCFQAAFGKLDTNAIMVAWCLTSNGEAALVADETEAETVATLVTEDNTQVSTPSESSSAPSSSSSD